MEGAPFRVSDLSDEEFESYVRSIEEGSSFEGFEECVPVPADEAFLGALCLALDRDAPCLGCGGCCKYFSEVSLLADEAADIARFLGICDAELSKRHSLRPRGTDEYRVKGDPCPFLSGSSCSVHAIKPLVCERYPLMNSPNGPALAMPSWCKRRLRGVLAAVLREFRGRGRA